MNVRLDAETVWLSQKQMAELFDSTTENIVQHLSSVYSDGELEERDNC